MNRKSKRKRKRLAIERARNQRRNVVAVTRTGRKLNSDHFRQLADEAERGYDIAPLIERHYDIDPLVGRGRRP